MNKLILCGAIILGAFSLSACLGGAASAVGQGVVSNSVSGALQTRAAQGMTCDQIEKDITTRNRGKINPLAIPSINKQVARMEAVAKEKGCSDYES